LIELKEKYEEEQESLTSYIENMKEEKKYKEEQIKA
jgi:hypothetical protein